MTLALLRATAIAFATALLGCPDKTPPPAGDASPAPSQSLSAATSGPVNATPLPSASVAAALGADRMPPYEGPTASVEGTIYVTGPAAPDVPADFSKCPEAQKTYGKLFREGAPQGDAGARPLVDALVGVTGYSGFYIPEKREAKLATIENCAFTQRTIDMTFGQRLDVLNKMPTTVYAPSLVGVTTPALMVAPPNGADPVHLYPPHPGWFLMKDRLDGVAPVTADVYVLLHPLHAVTDKDGHYRIDGLPVGKRLTVFARLAAIGETAGTIEPLAGVVHKLDLTLQYGAKDAGAPEGGAADAGTLKRPRDGGAPAAPR
jgi:hypothetical protein